MRLSAKSLNFFLALIYRGIEQGDFRKDFLPEFALNSVLVLLRAAVLTDEFKRIRLSASDLLLNTIANFTRGLSLSETMEAEVTSEAARRLAVRNRPITKSLLFHSDREGRMPASSSQAS